MKRSHGLRGIFQRPPGKWSAGISINGRKKHLGCFTTKEQAAAAYASAARLNNENAVCNYDSPEDAARAIRAAIEYNVLLHAGEMELIMEGKWSSSWRGLAIAAPGNRWGGACCLLPIAYCMLPIAYYRHLLGLEHC
jgi:hypothetical protein